MKKVLFVLLAVFCILPVMLKAEEPAGGAGEFQWAPVILAGADAVLAGLSVAAVIQQNSLATNYEELVKNAGTNYDMELYWRMKYEKEKVDSAGDLVLISCSAAGAALVYTALDFFVLHNAFKGSAAVKTGYNPGNREYSVIVSFKM
jgi:hypothetical protein